MATKKKAAKKAAPRKPRKPTKAVKKRVRNYKKKSFVLVCIWVR